MQSRVHTILALALASAFATSAFAQVPASTLPTGGTVAAGSASISTPTASTMRIDQVTDKAIINWNSFSIGSAASVSFVQPGASSVALNRVVGTGASEIFGRLTANGQVFLTNPSGVLIAPGGSVEVGGLVASTLSITDQDFLAGQYVFARRSGTAGPVVNQGTIMTPNGYTALLAPHVENGGLIQARMGTVVLAAGDRVSLDLGGDGLMHVIVEQAALNALALNSGTIEADGGRVILTVRSANALLDTVINNTGVIRANALVERDGEIILDGGSAGVVTSSGALLATRLTVSAYEAYYDYDPLLGTEPEIIAQPIEVPSELPSLSGVTINGGFFGSTMAQITQAVALTLQAQLASSITLTSGVGGTITLGSGNVALSSPLTTVEGTGISLPPGVTALP